MSHSQPSVSGILLCYNCENFIAEALQSALDQNCAPMQLIISDDASTDGTFAIVQAIVNFYKGSHNVTIYRRSINSGSKSAHLNSIFPLADGDIIVSFDGDDISERCRVRKIVNAFVTNPHAHAVYSSFSIIDEAGHPRGTARVPHPRAGERSSSWFARADAYAAGTTLAIRREVVEQFGALAPEINEDIILPFRASLLGEVVYIEEDLVKARRHSTSLTADHNRFESMELYRERIELGIERAKRHRASRFADLRAAAVLMPERATELQMLESVVRDSIAQAELSAGLVSTSPVNRLATLIRLWKTGAYPDERIRQMLLTFVPRLYLCYKRHSLKTRRQRLSN